MRASKSMCDISHEQISYGNCPWCKENIGELRPEYPHPSHKRALLFWVPGSVADGIQSSDAAVRYVTFTGLLNGFQLDEPMLEMFGQILVNFNIDHDRAVERVLIRAATSLNTAEADFLSGHRGTGARSEIPSRLMLIVHACRDEAPPAVDFQRFQDVLWTIAIMPWAYILSTYCARIASDNIDEFGLAMNFWNEFSRTHKGNLALLLNRAYWLLPYDRENANELMMQASAISPRDPVLQRLIKLYNEYSSG